MEIVTLPGTSVRCSRFIFGTASLFSAGDAAKRRHLLQAAVEHGFRHFDTAPYYGFGLAERDLAPVLRAHPDVGVTTKVGIYSPGGENQPAWSVFARKAAGRVVPAISRPTVDFAIDRARGALEASLRRLQRDHIELYMLHEPELALVQADEWQRWLEDEKRAGRIGEFGLALTADRLEPFLREAPGLAPVVQVLDSLDGREADVLGRFGRPLQITYGYVSGARRVGDTRPVPEILRAALARNPAGALIVATRKVERLGQYAALAGGA